MSNNLMQIYSAGEFSDDCYMQIQPRLFQQRLKEPELPIKFYIIKKTLVLVGGAVFPFLGGNVFNANAPRGNRS